MKVRLTSSLAGILAGMAVVVIGAGSAVAHDKHKREEVVRARLTSIQEVPAVTTPASGFLKAVIDDEADDVVHVVWAQRILGDESVELGVHPRRRVGTVRLRQS